MVLLALLATYRLDPDTVRPTSPNCPETGNPVMSEAFTGDPSMMLYSPIVPLFRLATNRLFPLTSMPSGKANPLTSAAFTVAPDVVYLPIVPVCGFVTKRFDPDIARP